jgi:hypothetical protein
MTACLLLDWCCVFFNAGVKEAELLFIFYFTMITASVPACHPLPPLLFLRTSMIMLAVFLKSQ